MKRWWQWGQTVLRVIFRHPVTGVAVIAILPNDGANPTERIVLVKRRDNGLWGLPGGLVEWGEDIPTTVQRELREETGLELVQICRLVGVYSAPDRDPRLHSICVVVEARVMGNLQAQDDLEIVAAAAFSPDEIPPTELAHDHARQLQDYFRGDTTLA
uniref:NUDIX hydrolase n=1 Tax=Cyanothece sp. (strain PCC 7425 / ATCC 29141) TaxID=395961 RepID=B8HPL9_CYAP4